jgi:hypothetical protein
MFAIAHDSWGVVLDDWAWSMGLTDACRGNVSGMATHCVSITPDLLLAWGAGVRPVFAPTDVEGIPS